MGPQNSKQQRQTIICGRRLRKKWVGDYALRTINPINLKRQTNEQLMFMYIMFQRGQDNTIDNLFLFI